MLKLAIKIADISPADLDKIISDLPFGENERTRLLSMRRKEAKELSLCARLALLDVSDTREDLSIKTLDGGKPIFEHSPFFFSLSHTSGIACAATCDTPVGVDIEWIDPSRKTDAIARRFFSPDEIEAIGNSSDRALAFFSLWTKKEAYAKLNGKGLASVCSDTLPRELIFNQYILEHNGKNAIISVCHHASEEISILNKYKEIKIYELQN